MAEPLLAAMMARSPGMYWIDTSRPMRRYASITTGLTISSTGSPFGKEAMVTGPAHASGLITTPRHRRVQMVLPIRSPHHHHLLTIQTGCWRPACLSTTDTPIRYLNPEPRYCGTAVHGSMVHLAGQVPAMNQVWEAWFQDVTTPPRATFQAALVNPDWKIEVVVTAAR
jgi:enamine deaminase RidA (YjgF/YER057c/UK114 family)